MQISVAEAHNRLSRWLKRVKEGPIAITRRGKPVGVIISPQEYDRLQQVQAYLQMLSLSQLLREGGPDAGDLYETSRAQMEERS